ncbi:MAG: hypothetical protein HQL48_04265 [Gammaproteobacteria bacterium]|nr:hypothetical protein [Gammaproteobacteria bacterium]
MQFPDDIRKGLKRRYNNNHRKWLGAVGDCQPTEDSGWPLEIPLAIPTEKQALQRIEDVRGWVAVWRSWSGAGSVLWSERRWRKLGTQSLPDRLLLRSPAEVAQWIGETERWQRARQRYLELVAIWPRLVNRLCRYFDLLADYDEENYRRLIAMISWIERHSDSNLYPRQLPVPGLDSKWLEQRKGVVADLLDVIRDQPSSGADFYQRCGLRTLPQLIRLRILDHNLRARVGGLAELSTPIEQLAKLDLPAANVFIIENLQTGLAFEDLPASVVIMQLGYGVDILGRLPWIARAQSIYWGDIDTHGFAILNRARGYLPQLQSLLMDETTLFQHKELWVEEREQHPAKTLPLLSAPEQRLYRAIKNGLWGDNIRLEQERIAWEFAWKKVQQAV